MAGEASVSVGVETVIWIMVWTCKHILCMYIHIYTTACHVEDARTIPQTAFCWLSCSTHCVNIYLFAIYLQCILYFLGWIIFRGLSCCGKVPLPPARCPFPTRSQQPKIHLQSISLSKQAIEGCQVWPYMHAASNYLPAVASWSLGIRIKVYAWWMHSAFCVFI